MEPARRRSFLDVAPLGHANKQRYELKEQMSQSRNSSRRSPSPLLINNFDSDTSDSEIWNAGGRRKLRANHCESDIGSNDESDADSCDTADLVRTLQQSKLKMKANTPNDVRNIDSRTPGATDCLVTSQLCDDSGSNDQTAHALTLHKSQPSLPVSHTQRTSPYGASMGDSTADRADGNRQTDQVVTLEGMEMLATSTSLCDSVREIDPPVSDFMLQLPSASSSSSFDSRGDDDPSRIQVAQHRLTTPIFLPKLSYDATGSELGPSEGSHATSIKAPDLVDLSSDSPEKNDANDDQHIPEVEPFEFSSRRVRRVPIPRLESPWKSATGVRNRKVRNAASYNASFAANIVPLQQQGSNQHARNMAPLQRASETIWFRQPIQNKNVSNRARSTSAPVLRNDLQEGTGVSAGNWLDTSRKSPPTSSGKRGQRKVRQKRSARKSYKKGAKRSTGGGGGKSWSSKRSRASPSQRANNSAGRNGVWDTIAASSTSSRVIQPGGRRDPILQNVGGAQINF